MHVSIAMNGVLIKEVAMYRRSTVVPYDSDLLKWVSK